ncbi:hypothetical protein [Luteolibacter luteus]|uniref:Uncharacterized protein n=1 Tax=Luteolibacter luteus TaxID=2728835 RepID=A0A858RH06_9BACT|nr:hypothetical protein [Luteolibacter luteus]QJE96446.1 hypothetical protein HHL09_11845 [Luteolibacter luteus]
MRTTVPLQLIALLGSFLGFGATVVPAPVFQDATKKIHTEGYPRLSRTNPYKAPLLSQIIFDGPPARPKKMNESAPPGKPREAGKRA